MNVISRWQGGSHRLLAIITAIALAVALVLAPVFLLQGLPLAHAAAAALMVVVPGAALGTAAWSFALLRPRTVAAHVAAALSLGLVWTLSIALLAFAVHPEAAVAFLRKGAAWQIVAGLVVYGAVAAAATATRTGAQLRERELAASGAELAALRARLHPHFLFNTLHSLTQLAREDPGATERALERFGEMMRYVIDAGREGGEAEVALEDELGFVRDYLALEALRLGDRLRITEAVAEEALELAVPPLLVQPLVENAVRYGIAPRQAGGMLRIGAAVMGRTLWLEVADDGSGARVRSSAPG